MKEKVKNDYNHFTSDIIEACGVDTNFFISWLNTFNKHFQQHTNASKQLSKLTQQIENLIYTHGKTMVRPLLLCLFFYAINFGLPQIKFEGVYRLSKKFKRRKQ